MRPSLTDSARGTARKPNLSSQAGARIPSLARSLLVRRKCPVAVLMDSGSVDPDVIEERQQTTEDFIRAADASIPVKVVTAMPEIEAWFLATPETMEHIVEQSLYGLALLGKRDPHGALTAACRGKQEKHGTLIKPSVRSMPKILSKFAPSRRSRNSARSFRRRNKTH